MQIFRMFATIMQRERGDVMKHYLVGRVLAGAVCILLLFCLLPSAYATETADIEAARQAIMEGYANHAETVDLSLFCITADQLQEIFWEDKYAGKYPWYAGSYTYTYGTSSGYVKTLRYINLDPTKYNYALYEQKVAEILAATVFEGMSDWQIALSIHDYLAAYGEYDETYTYYLGYDLLVRGTSVCDGYTKAYMDLLNRVGIPCVRVVSEAMNHSWNLVQIGGQWYHVDVTWDDPTSNREGRVSHKYFLLSDDTIADEDHEHHGWETDIVCSDTSMETDCFWLDIDSRIIYEGADQCYFRLKTGQTTHAIYSRTGDGTETKLVSWDADYLDVGEGDYYYANYGLSLYEGRLYYSSMNKVFSVTTNGKSKKTVYTHAASTNKKYIAGSFVEDDILYLTLSDHDGNLIAMQMELGIDGHSHSYTSTETAATCTQFGYSEYVCQCGIHFEADYIPAAGHSYGEGQIVQAATAEEAGLMRYTCETCGYSHTEEIPRLSPSEGTDTGDQAPAAEEDNTTKYVLLGIGAIAVLLLLKKKKK